MFSHEKMEIEEASCCSISTDDDYFNREAKVIKEKSVRQEPFSDRELDELVDCLKSLGFKQTESSSKIDWIGYKNVLRRYAHLSHKEWDRTEQGAQDLEEIFDKGTSE